MDNLKKYFDKNRGAFDYIEPDTDSWEELDKKMSSSVASKEEIEQFANRYWLKTAAVLAIGLLVSFLFFQQNQKSITNSKNLVGLEEDMYFPDLSLPDPKGDAVALSSLKGKIVLVEFWASYCMLCTEEHCYYFKPLYNDYKDKGFEIYSISADSSATNWVQAIERDGLDWIQVSDLLGNDSPMIHQYDVNALPTNYLLDQDGKIIARNVDVAILEETLEDLMALR